MGLVTTKTWAKKHLRSGQLHRDPSTEGDTYDGNLHNVIVGKFGEMACLDGVWDVWIKHPDRRQRLGEGKVNNIVKHLKAYTDSKPLSLIGPIHRLDHEAWFRTKDEDLLFHMLPALGIHRKMKPKQLSEEDKRRLRERLASIKGK